MYSRRFFTDGMKSLLHFDYPYHGASNSALHDELGLCSWSKNGAPMFASSYSPADVNYYDAPKFGYRCLYTQSESDYIFSVNSIFDSQKFSAEIFINLRSSSEGRIFSFMCGNSISLSLMIRSGGYVAVNSAMSDTALNINTWYHLRMNYKDNNVYVYLDGNLILTANSIHLQGITALRIGGCHALFDEFAFWDESREASIPYYPYEGYLDLVKMGGFGDGHDGEFKTALTTNHNPEGKVTSAYGTSFTVDTWYPLGNFTKINAGDEIMFYVTADKKSTYHELAGLFAFRHIVYLNNYSFVIDSPVIDEFDMEEAFRNYTVYALKVPNYTTFRCTAIYPSYHARVGIIRSTEDMTFINTFITTSTTNFYNVPLAPGDLPDRLLGVSSHGIFLCGGTLSLLKERSTARLSVDNCNILAAAKKLNIDSSTFPRISTSLESGLHYLAGEWA